MSHPLKFDINRNFYYEYINIDVYIKEYLRNFTKSSKLHQLKEIIYINTNSINIKFKPRKYEKDSDNKNEINYIIVYNA